MGRSIATPGNHNNSGCSRFCKGISNTNTCACCDRTISGRDGNGLPKPTPVNLYGTGAFTKSKLAKRAEHLYTRPQEIYVGFHDLARSSYVATVA